MLLDTTHLAPNEALITFLIALVTGIALIAIAFRQRQRYRLIADTPTSKIRSAAQGFVELEGHVQEGSLPLLHSPLGNRQCVWYSYSVDRQVREDKKTRWVSERSGSSTQWFQIDDSTGQCMIDPTGADVNTLHQYTWYGDSLFPATIGDSGHLFNHSLLNNRYRYTERLIFPHEKLYALGHFQSVGGGRDTLNLEQVSGDLIREWKQSYQQLIAQYDSNQDGQIDLQEWQAVKQAAWQQALAQQAEVHTMPTVHVLDRPPGNGRPLLISTHDQRQLLRRARLWSLALNLLGIGALYLAAELTLAL